MNLTTEDFLALPGTWGDRNQKDSFCAFAITMTSRSFIRGECGAQPDKRSASAVFPFLIVKKETTLPKLKELMRIPSDGWRRWVRMRTSTASNWNASSRTGLDGEQARLERFTGRSSVSNPSNAAFATKFES